MKKFLMFLGILVCLIILALVLVWFSKTRIAQRALQKQLGVPVKIQELTLTTQEAEIHKIHIGNPKGSKTKTAFAAEKIVVESNIGQILGNPLTIDVVELDQVFIGIELYGKGEDDSNWNRILNHQPKKKKKKSLNYLIKNIYVNQLTVSVTQPNGKTTVYPTLSHMEFHNISDESGLPVDEIEKAIFKLVLQSVIEKYGIQSILKSINPQNLPFKVLPFFPKKSAQKNSESPSSSAIAPSEENSELQAQ